MVRLIGHSFRFSLKNELHFRVCSIAGNLTARHREIFSRNPLFMGMRVPEVKETEPLEKRYPKILHDAMDIIKVCDYNDPSFFNVF